MDLPGHLDQLVSFMKSNQFASGGLAVGLTGVVIAALRNLPGEIVRFFSRQVSLEVLIRNHRINDLGGIVEALASYIREATNTVAADVRTAHVLSDAERAELQSTLERKFGRKVELGLTTDPALLGGFVAKVGSEIYDASVVGKIERFRESLS